MIVFIYNKNIIYYNFWDFFYFFRKEADIYVIEFFI